MRETISAVVLTFNEEEFVRDCLESVKWVDEIVVVDSGSTDRTLDICREYTDRIFYREFKGFGSQKNFAIERASCDWVLYIEADERATPGLVAEIKEVLSGRGKGFVGFKVPRLYVHRGRPLRHGGFYPHLELRLFRRGKAKFEERLRHSSARAEGPVGRLRSPIIHLVSRGDYLEFLRRSVEYARLEAEQDFKEGIRATLPKMVLLPAWRFMVRYFLKLGFLDGVPGLLFCFARAFQDFVEYAALWELERKGGVEVEARPEGKEMRPLWP